VLLLVIVPVIDRAGGPRCFEHEQDYDYEHAMKGRTVRPNPR